MAFKRVALFSKREDAFVHKVLSNYAADEGYIITVSFSSEQEILDNPKEDFDAVLMLIDETLLLPLSGIEIIKIPVAVVEE